MDNKRKCLDTRRIANSTKSTNEAQWATYIKWAVHLCVCTSVWRCFRVYTGDSPLSLLYNVLIDCRELEKFAIMKKYFVLSVFIMLIGAFTNVQSQNVEKSTTPEKGVLVSGNVRLCNYEKGCLIAGNGMKNWTQKLEISYDGSDKTYGIYINVRGDIINLSVKHKSSGKESHTYEGIDRVTRRKVVVVTKQKLSSYLNNNGVASHTEVESPKGIIVTVPSTYTVFSVIPIKNE